MLCYETLHLIATSALPGFHTARQKKGEAPCYCKVSEEVHPPKRVLLIAAGQGWEFQFPPWPLPISFLDEGGVGVSLLFAHDLLWQ